MAKRLASFLVLLVVTLTASSVVAQTWSPFPTLRSRQHVAVDPALAGDRWDAARECLPNIDSPVGASYYAAAVPVTDRWGNNTPSANDAVPYVDALYEQWRERLDPERHVLIVLGLENRAVAIHPGTRWVGMGFERNEITRTIDNSAFKTFARSGDYGQALCALGSAVDSRLTQLEKSAEQIGRATAVDIDDLRDEVSTIPALVKRASDVDPKLGEWARGQLTLMQDRLEAAASALGTQPVQAANYARDSRQILERVEQVVEEAEQHRRLTPGWQAEIEELRREVQAQPDAPWVNREILVAMLSECEQGIAAERAALTSGRTVSPFYAERCMGSVEERLEQANQTHFIMTRVVPGVIGGVVLVSILIMMLVAAVRRRRVERLVEMELADWKETLDIASERLLDLEREFALYFDSGRQAWTGDSAKLDQRCADEVNQLFLMFAKAKDIYDEAVRDLRSAPELRTAPLEKLLERLKNATVKIETGEKETRRRISLPLTRTYEAKSSQFLEDLGGSYRRAARYLEVASELMEEVDDLRTKLSRTSADLAQEVEKRSDYGLPIDHLLEAQNRGEEQRQRGRDIANSDPRKAVRELGDALEKIEEAGRIATVGNRVLLGVREELPATRARLRARIDTMREKGWVVRERGFDPDQRLDHAARVGQRAVERVATGKEDEALGIWEKLAADMAELDRQLEATREAKDGVPKRLEQLRERHEANEARIPEAKKILKELGARHAQEAFQREADNLQEYALVREQVLAGFSSATQAHEEQRYLAAWADLETLDEALTLAGRLIGELHDVLRKLEEAKALTEERFAAARHHFEAIAGIRYQTLGVDADLAAEVAETHAALQQLNEELASERPHWLALGARASGLAAGSADLRDEVTAEVRRHHEATIKYSELQSRGRDLAQRVLTEKRDRPHVEAVLNDALDALARVEPFLEDPEVGGSELLEAVDYAGSWLDRAAADWKSELAAIQKAEGDLAAAERRYNQVDGTGYGYGVYADCSDALEVLNEARAAASRRDWEQVVQYAASTIVRVDAENKRAEFASDRKRRSAQRAARSYSSSSSSSSFSSSSSSFSSSSWSSSSSSFSSSSSSGGSSFGSSSGGSSW